MSFRWNRRSILSATVSGFFGLAMRNRLASAFSQSPSGAAKKCLVLWMNGGPSQLDTFDPKPGTVNGGEFSTISTSVPGIAISEVLPQIASATHNLALLRCLTSAEGEHQRGQYFLHTGYRFVPGFPRPGLGAIISQHVPPSDIPQYVTIGSSGYGPAYLGPDHAPFSIEDPAEASELLKRIRRRTARLELLQRLGQSFGDTYSGAALRRRTAMVDKIENLISTSFVDSLDLNREPQRVKRRYGEGSFARACLLARRLLQNGVSFVEVQHNGWDTHANNFSSMRRLCGEIDQPWRTLMDELQASGLWQETLVVWMGEFGRTPTINANQGRDHFPRVTPVVLGEGV